MREIKFRAWGDNGDGYKMHYNIWEFNGYFIPYDKHHDPICDHNLMQYTGLKDKNGIEAYESDFVKINNSHHNLDGIFEIVWSNEFSGWDLKIIDWSLGNKELPDIDSVKSGEILGNIHENPELLNYEEK